MRLASLSTNPVLQQYAQGAAQSAAQPLADFLAPVVEVGSSVGRFKKYTEKSRFRIPNTLRGNTGRATEIGFDRTDATYNCQPHALDFPLDIEDTDEAEDWENLFMEGADMVAEVSALAHEKTVVDMALGAAGSGADHNFKSATVDPVDLIDQAIINVTKAAKYGSLMNVGILVGPTAARLLKNNSQIRNLFKLGTGKGGMINPTLDMVGDLFISSPDVRLSMMVYDDAAEGLDEDIKFLIDDAILVFARHPNPTRRDPSFMKTFRKRGKWMVPGTYKRDDGRVEVAKLDWSCDPQISNTQGVIRLNAKEE